jgi:hypothetical protein
MEVRGRVARLKSYGTLEMRLCLVTAFQDREQKAYLVLEVAGSRVQIGGFLE